MSSFLAVLIVLTTFALGGLGVFLSKWYFGGRLYFFSPAIVASFYYVIRSYPGVVDSAFELHDPRPLVAVLLAVLGFVFALGFLAIVDRRRQLDCGYSSISFPSELVLWVPVALGSLAVFVTFLMLGRVPIAYLAQDLFGSGADISMHEARRMNTLEHRAGDTVYFGQGYLRLIYLNIAPVFVAILYLERKLRGDGVGVPKVLMFLFCLFAGMNGQIWPVVNTVIFFALIAFASDFLLVAENERYPSVVVLVRRVVVAFFVIMGFIFVYRYAQFLSGRYFENFFLDTFRRIYAADTAELFVIFPERYPFRVGVTWLNDLAGFLPGSSQSFAYEVHYLIHGGAWGFTLAPGLFASAYVNFGMYGVFGLFLVVFFGYSFLYKALAGSGRAEDMVLAILLSISLAISLSADIVNVVMPVMLVVGIRLMIGFFHVLFRVPRERIDLQ